MGPSADQKQNEHEEDVDACDVDFSEGEQTKDEDLPVAFGGEA